MEGTSHRQWWWEQEFSLDEDPLVSTYSSDGSTASEELSPVGSGASG